MTAPTSSDNARTSPPLPLNHAPQPGWAILHFRDDGEHSGVDLVRERDFEPDAVWDDELRPSDICQWKTQEDALVWAHNNLPRLFPERTYLVFDFGSAPVFSCERPA